MEEDNVRAPDDTRHDTLINDQDIAARAAFDEQYQHRLPNGMEGFDMNLGLEESIKEYEAENQWRKKKIKYDRQIEECLRKNPPPAVHISEEYLSSVNRMKHNMRRVINALDQSSATDVEKLICNIIKYELQEIKIKPQFDNEEQYFYIDHFFTVKKIHINLDRYYYQNSEENSDDYTYEEENDENDEYTYEDS